MPVYSDPAHLGIIGVLSEEKGPHYMQRAAGRTALENTLDMESSGGWETPDKFRWISNF